MNDPTALITENQVQFEDDDANSASASARRRVFAKELRLMLFGYGDDKNPFAESVDLLEDLVFEFIADMTRKAMEVKKKN